jgi:hypothetical protein
VSLHHHHPPPPSASLCDVRSVPASLPPPPPHFVSCSCSRQLQKLKEEAEAKEKARKAALDAVDVQEGDYQVQVGCPAVCGCGLPG